MKRIAQFGFLAVAAVLSAGHLALLAADPSPARPQSGQTEYGSRTLFETRGGSRFIYEGFGKWTETRTGDVSSHFREALRDRYYVVLKDSDRRMYVRLSERRGEWRSFDGGDWAPWPGSEGMWIR